MRLILEAARVKTGLVPQCSGAAFEFKQARRFDAEHLRVALISHTPYPAHDAERRSRPRTPDIDDCDPQKQLIAGTNRIRPPQIVQAR